MSEVQMESARVVNPADRQESALHREIYNPTTQWANFEKLNAQSNGERNPNYLDMSASDPYNMDRSNVNAPEVGDPKRLGLRQNRQEHAIFDGISSGEIDFDEFTKLQQEQDLIAAVQQYFGADGLSEQELQGLDLLQNGARQHILDAGGADEITYAAEDMNATENKTTEQETPHESDSEEPTEHESPKESGHGKPPEHESPKESGEESKDKAQKESFESEEIPSPEEQFQKFLKFLDQDGDGQISLNEILQAFQAMDSSKDGVVSPEEFQKLMAKLAKKEKGDENAKEVKPESPPRGGGGHASEPKSGGEQHSSPETGGEHNSEPESGGAAPYESEEGGDRAPEEATSNPEESSNDGSDQPETSDGERYPDAEQMKMIYIFPDSQQVWQKLNQDAPAGSMIVTLPSADVSWNSDQPFNSIDPQLKANIAEASANGLTPMGYVGTRGGTRPIKEVKAEIDSWYKNADIKGIYLGDSGNHTTSGGYATDPATEAYFQEIGDYIHSKGGIAAVNGSGSPNPDYANKFIQGTHEGYANAMPESQDWQEEHPPGRFAAMLVGVQQQDIGKIVQQARQNHNGYVFIAPEYGQAPTENEAYWNEVIRSLRGS